MLEELRKLKEKVSKLERKQEAIVKKIDRLKKNISPQVFDPILCKVIKRMASVYRVKLLQHPKSFLPMIVWIPLDITPMLGMSGRLGKKYGIEKHSA